eukprot:m.285704 g.285704  ORF g.285704 m.285704 type:complete len:85 (+) comp17774_c0_seq32:216-470(+)
MLNPLSEDCTVAVVSMMSTCSKLGRRCGSRCQTSLHILPSHTYNVTSEHPCSAQAKPLITLGETELSMVGAPGSVLLQAAGQCQ